MIRYSPEVARGMYELRMGGWTQLEVAKLYGVSATTVATWVARYVRSGAVELVVG